MKSDENRKEHEKIQNRHDMSPIASPFIAICSTCNVRHFFRQAVSTTREPNAVAKAEKEQETALDRRTSEQHGIDQRESKRYEQRLKGYRIDRIKMNQISCGSWRSYGSPKCTTHIELTIVYCGIRRIAKLVHSNDFEGGDRSFEPLWLEA